MLYPWFELYPPHPSSYTAAPTVKELQQLQISVASVADENYCMREEAEKLGAQIAMGEWIGDGYRSIVSSSHLRP